MSRFQLPRQSAGIQADFVIRHRQVTTALVCPLNGIVVGAGSNLVGVIVNRPFYDGPGNRNYGHGTRNTTEAQKISQMGAHCRGERGATAVLWDPGMVERKSAQRIVVDRCTAATHPRSGTHVRRVPG